MSRPRPNSKGQAYIESFEGEGGLTVSLADNAWYYSSQPTLGARLPGRVGARALDLARATTLAWQTNGTDRSGNDVRFTIEQIDPQTNIVGAGVSAPETLLWLTLYPLAIGGQRDPTTNTYRWKVVEHVAGPAVAIDPHLVRPVGRGSHWRRDDRVLGAGGYERGTAVIEPHSGVGPG